MYLVENIHTEFIGKALIIIPQFHGKTIKKYGAIGHYTLLLNETDLWNLAVRPRRMGVTLTLSPLTTCIMHDENEYNKAISSERKK